MTSRLPIRVPYLTDNPFTLVVSSPDQGRKPWYLDPA